MSRLTAVLKCSSIYCMPELFSALYLSHHKQQGPNLRMPVESNKNLFGTHLYIYINIYIYMYIDVCAYLLIIRQFNRRAKPLQMHTAVLRGLDVFIPPSSCRRLMGLTTACHSLQFLIPRC